MGKGVFLHRPDSRYDDRPEEQYQFPSQYLSRASQFVDDWIMYYEPRRGGIGKGYYAIAKVDRIVPDPTVERMYLALIEPGSYLPFERPVPFSGVDGVVESGLLNERGGISGRAQAAVRPISNEDFDSILDRGFVEEGAPLPRFSEFEPSKVAEHRPEFVFDQARERISYLSSRIVRTACFAGWYWMPMIADVPSPACGSSTAVVAPKWKRRISSPSKTMAQIASTMALRFRGPFIGCSIGGSSA